MGCCFGKDEFKLQSEPPRVDIKTYYCPGGRPYISDEAVSLIPLTKSSYTNWNGDQNSNALAHHYWGSTFILPTMPNLQYLPEKQKAQLAERWIMAGQAEHASVASFALFSQKLLCIGAPPELIRECYECAMEEIEHAKLSFALASAYAGRLIEPTTYDAHTMTVQPDILSLIEGTIREACIQETISAFSAARQGEVEEDPAVKYVLLRITGDEAHHAAFAWKVVCWSLKAHRQHSDKICSLMETLISKWSLTGEGGDVVVHMDKGNRNHEDLQMLCNLREIVVSKCRNVKEGQEAKEKLVERIKSQKVEDAASEVVLRILESVS
eukprot:TRINITY_DN702_c1_g1_i1.p1 TRINITY_DN702_c1_g1~~TRINITY_DN702_c1_g1_i1.p1  ORF type:complete len:325 (+),score=65.13 TRINITY_DN702_c1_g1_i1:83-1057(+)